VPSAPPRRGGNRGAWIAAGVIGTVLAVVVTAAVVSTQLLDGSGGGHTTGSDTDEPAARETDAAGNPVLTDGRHRATRDDVITATFEAGETARFEDDDEVMEITVGTFEPYTPTDWAVGEHPGETPYRVSVTVENAGQAAFRTNVGFRARADTGAEADGITDYQNNVDDSLRADILPGRSAVEDFAFSVPEGSRSVDLTLELGQTFADVAIWTIEVPS
jgi:hypothetical protein